MPSAARPNIAIEALRAEHWSAVRAIYLEGIASGNATFEKNAPEWQQWDKEHFAFCRLVARLDGAVEIAGWAALSPVSRRTVYAGVAEVSVYIAQSARRRGVGLALLSKLIEESEPLGIWTLQAGIFPENIASVELHRCLGFRVVGVRERLGCMDGRWRDVVLLERRSSRFEHVSQ